MFYVLLYVTLYPFSFAIILMGKRELVALLSLSSWCLVMVERLFFVVSWVCLRFVFVVFPDHTDYFCNHPAGEVKVLFYFYCFLLLCGSNVLMFCASSSLRVFVLRL